ncbi:uncharacterized protein LOC124129302 [Haliotis rufescens]|uniref:uncharacterized protein LOC124129302 n=1 Tax=Haliotis rufescens TaxID=6454 RepID=UPI00201EF603|nr:uncharacterized protein LOC124129302 [Haliotis rufescens]
MDDFGQSSTKMDSCNVCRHDGKTTPATSWCSVCNDAFCSECLKLHNKMPNLRDHEIVDLLTQGRRKSAPHPMCKLHKDKRIELFCKDCKVALCTLCCSIKHRKCDDVDTIEHMNPLVKEELLQKTRRLKGNVKSTARVMSMAQSQIKELTRNAENVKTQIRDTHRAATEVLMKKKKELMDQVDRSTDRNIQELKAFIKSQEIDQQMYQQEAEFVEKAVTTESVADMYDVYESAAESNTDTDTDAVSRPTSERVIFTHDMDEVRASVEDIQLGHIDIVKDVSDRTSSPRLYHTVDCHTENVLNFVRDVTVLTVACEKVIVITDSGNNVKAFYGLKSKPHHKCLTLSCKPYRLAKMSDSQVAVSVPDKKMIAMIGFNPDPVLLSTMTTKHKHLALAFLSQSQLLASNSEVKHSLDILDMSGNVLKSVNTGIVPLADFIHVTRGNNVLVSAGGVASLVCVTGEGEAVFTYTPTGDRALRYPHGIATTSTGDILLADWDSRKVIQLTESGQFVRDVLTDQEGLQCPSGICLDSDGLLYVSCLNNVKVFKFTQ